MKTLLCCVMLVALAAGALGAGVGPQVMPRVRKDLAHREVLGASSDVNHLCDWNDLASEVQFFELSQNGEHLPCASNVIPCMCLRPSACTK